MNIEDTCFGFVGLGLIGGSLAKTIKRICPDAHIIAYNRTESITKKAQAEGIIDVACDKVDERFSPCDYIFLCMPVSCNIKYLELLSGIIKETCILTDVGSVKTDIHKHVIKLGLEKKFIGGHPMAGSDKTGCENASSHLLDGAYYIITPSARSEEHAVQDYYALVQKLGAIPLILDYEEHDYFTANISHVPHLIASSLVNMVQDADNSQQIMKKIAASGFRDTTRIASGSPVMWQQICMTNSENICQVLDSYIDILSKLRDSIVSQSSDELYHFLEKAMKYRRSL